MEAKKCRSSSQNWPANVRNYCPYFNPHEKEITGLPADSSALAMFHIIKKYQEVMHFNKKRTMIMRRTMRSEQHKRSKMRNMVNFASAKHQKVSIVIVSMSAAISI